MIDHVNIPVSNLNTSELFYSEVLKTLGFSLLLRDSDAIGYGKHSWEFGIVRENAGFTLLHLAFKAISHDAVRAFYHTAIEMGARDNGAPGAREHYGPHYYSAFVYDLNGHNIEAVCRNTNGTEL